MPKWRYVASEVWWEVVSCGGCFMPVMPAGVPMVFVRLEVAFRVKLGT